MKTKTAAMLPGALLALLTVSCGDDRVETQAPLITTGSGYNLVSTSEIIVTSEQGDKLAPETNVRFNEGQAKGVVIVVQPDVHKQTIVGLGSSFTESSAFVLAHLGAEDRRSVMNQLFGEDGANFSLARTTIGSSDFSVKGKYSYADEEDATLEHFSVDVDRDGFRQSEYHGVKDESYDLLPMIQEAFDIKAGQQQQDLRLVASAWTAPPWMKDIEDWFINDSSDGSAPGTGGTLKEEYIPVYADYLVRYLDAYRAEGIDIWGLTPVNEPEGNNGQWESMHFTPETQNEFIKSYLGPALQGNGYEDLKLLIYDQNRDNMMHWADAILGDPDTAKYVYGTAVHWYASTISVFEEELEQLHQKFPAFDIIHTEGTIDNLGKEAGGGITDPVGFKESNWFNNDSFWWNKTATDWAYSATWAPNQQDHPMYVPVHRYARNIIVSLDNWVSGWIDWNVVLDSIGGPNHVENYCGAPIMVDVDTGQVYYTPVYHVLAQFSRTIRPGDTVVQTKRQLNGLDEDALHAVSTLNGDNLLSVQLLNTTKQPIEFGLQIGTQFAQVVIPANAVQTVRVQLNGITKH
jgi:glucosylceramidase